MWRLPMKFDGLWYCLCPSFQLSYIHRPALSLNGRQKASRRCLNSGSSASIRFVKKSRPQDVAQPLAKNKIVPPKGKGHTDDGHSSKIKSPSSQQTAQILEDRLEAQSLKRRNDIPATARILQYIFRNPNVLPNSRHYKALILANVDPLHGSPKNVRSLLQEMEAEGITVDSATLHAALEALAIHPDYILRQDIIGALRTRWLSLSPAGWHHLITGLVREGQLELALDRVNHMERQGIRLEQWLHSLIVYNLCDVDDLDEALNLMRGRADKTNNISEEMWLYLLEVSLRASHLELVNYVWTNAVDLSYADLSIQHCRDVLDLASLYGDTQLAESVFRQLIILGELPSQELYERVVQAYAVNGDLDSSLEILCRMQNDGFLVRPRSTQPVLTLLEQLMPDPTHVWASITKLREQKFNIPVGLANAVIEYCDAASAPGSVSATEAVDIGLDIYRDIFDVCSSGADVITFNNLFTLCLHANRPDAGTFLAKEMAALDIEPNRQTLEALILLCLQADNYRSAYMYTADLVERGWQLSETVAERICAGCADHGAADVENLLRLVHNSSPRLQQGESSSN